MSRGFSRKDRLSLELEENPELLQHFLERSDLILGDGDGGWPEAVAEQVAGRGMLLRPLSNSGSATVSTIILAAFSEHHPRAFRQQEKLDGRRDFAAGSVPSNHSVSRGGDMPRLIPRRNDATLIVNRRPAGALAPEGFVRQRSRSEWASSASTSRSARAGSSDREIRRARPSRRPPEAGDNRASWSCEGDRTGRFAHPRPAGIARRPRSARPLRRPARVPCPIALGLRAELDQRGGGVYDHSLAPLGPVVDCVDHPARKRTLTVPGERLEHPFGFRAEVQPMHDRFARQLELERRADLRPPDEPAEPADQLGRQPLPIGDDLKVGCTNRNCSNAGRGGGAGPTARTYRPNELSCTTLRPVEIRRRRESARSDTRRQENRLQDAQGRMPSATASCRARIWPPGKDTPRAASYSAKATSALNGAGSIPSKARSSARPDPPARPIPTRRACLATATRPA